MSNEKNQQRTQADSFAFQRSSNNFSKHSEPRTHFGQTESRPVKSSCFRCLSQSPPSRWVSCLSPTATCHCTAVEIAHRRQLRAFIPDSHSSRGTATSPEVCEFGFILAAWAVGLLKSVSARSWPHARASLMPEFAQETRVFIWMRGWSAIQSRARGEVVPYRI